MSELKPCPHCKSDSVRIQHKQVGFLGQNDFGAKKIKYQSYGMCNKCFAKGPPTTIVYLADTLEGRETLRLNDEKATAVWNRRSQPNEPLTCEGCVDSRNGDTCGMVTCIRNRWLGLMDHYRRKPEGVT